VVQVIQEQCVLCDLPGRTETDLFLWISQHRVAIRQELGLDLKPESAVTRLVDQFNPKPERVAARLGRKLLDVVMPDGFGSGPPPGQWRTEHVAARPGGRLFADVLVAINGEEAGWQALDLALEVARREEAQVHGFHAEPSEVDSTGEHLQAVEAEFNRRCQAAGLAGKLTFEVGDVARKIRERSWWVDLIVLSLAYPPGPQLTARLASGFRTILHHCARPVLAVPGPVSRLERALLAYDGSPKADEALFVATYLADRWSLSLVVVTVESERTKPEVMGRASNYLEAHGVQATYTHKRGAVAEAILQTAEEHESDLILMGSYGPHPLLEAVRDSTVNHVLRASRRPMLI
jgi:nucleotide-binding universal stress UspA family protein